MPESPHESQSVSVTREIIASLGDKALGEVIEPTDDSIPVIEVGTQARGHVLLGLQHLRAKNVSLVSGQMIGHETKGPLRMDIRQGLIALLAMNVFDAERGVQHKTFTNYRTQLAEAIVLAASGQRTPEERPYYADPHTVDSLLHDQSYLLELVNPAISMHKIEIWKTELSHGVSRSNPHP